MKRIKKSAWHFLAWHFLLALLVACSNGSTDGGGGGGTDGGGNIAVTLTSVTANGNATTTTSALTLAFSAPVAGLSAADIALSGVPGVTKGTLTGTNPYTLPIGGFSTDGTLNVAVSKAGYAINGSPTTVLIKYTSSDIHTHDFTTQFALLGLPNGTNPSGQMETRWNNAKDLDDGYGVIFYPIISYPFAGTILTSYHFTHIYGGPPAIRLIADGSNIRVFANTTGASTINITLDYVVLRSDGKGWFTAGSSQTVPAGTGIPGEVGTMNRTISSLTNSKITNVSGLSSGGYKVYAIVRSADALNWISTDLNSHSNMKQKNVIRIYPDAES